MPEIDYNKSNVKVNKVNYDYPKLSLAKDEKARILLIEKSPSFEWTHELKRPMIENGQPVMEMTAPMRGEPKSVNKMDFLSRPVCLGDAGILDDAGLDPKNCPMCELARKNPEATKAPVRRFATHIIRYKTKGGSFNLITPFQPELLVWSFTERMFGQLADFRDEWTDLRRHDLLISCGNAKFQNYEINVAKDAAWLENEDTKTLTRAIYDGGKIEDLSIACGRKTELRWIETDLDKIAEAWADVAAARGHSNPTSSLDADLGALAAEEDWATPKAEPVAAKAKAKAAPAKAAKAEAKADDLDDLFDVGDDAPAAKEPISDIADDDLAEPAAEPEEAPAPVATKAPVKKPAVKSAAEASVDDELDALLG